MEPTPSNTELETTPAEVYLWNAPGQPVTVELQLQVVDRLSMEVMRGFGLVPKRGAEVGGLLLGHVTQDGAQYVVRIEEFEPIPIEYARGPSFLLSQNDQPALLGALDRWAPGQHANLEIVGFYRSHTREGLTLTEEDLQILDAYFPAPYQVCLLIKPFATKVSQAGFLCRKQGEFRSYAPESEFPFRRRELGGGAMPPLPAAPAVVPAPEVKRVTRVLPEESNDVEEALLQVPEDVHAVRSYGGYSPADPVQSESRGRWITMALVGLMLCLAIGVIAYQMYRRSNPARAFRSGDPYALELTAAPVPDGFRLNWNAASEAVRSAQRGKLLIDDGKNPQVVELRPDQLRSGTLIYKQLTDTIMFRLEVYPSDRTAVSESVSFQGTTRSTPPTVAPNSTPQEPEQAEPAQTRKRRQRR